MTDVLNPSPVPIRLDSAAVGVYSKLAVALATAAMFADDQAASAEGDPAAEFRTVRDALRRAAGEALTPRGGTRRPHCRRCGIACPECSPHEQPEPGSVTVDVDVLGFSRQRLLVQPGTLQKIDLYESRENLAGREPAHLRGVISVVLP